ncbi:peptidoglycan DD-metalloendopeptidase family protein [Taylorella equigenitalis]|uniref:peptidoglycan DD-metalloendopeptidase family protein n=1 Tax=Taylorella equigenitalis TaxID=29575 RepID=UPI00040127B5|nr:peptidoglycan DD-metalloendopeptidase family protein [Taylorella equigenitalis]WDU46511.1 peptidoglycan DD-metalloendopeptidase family protein [Taylorella equigenitalis]WDU49505.1 peptidoglycan DD-metalloendopeptidase family protein [Taylorella equigenitalis]
MKWVRAVAFCLGVCVTSALPAQVNLTKQQNQVEKQRIALQEKIKKLEQEIEKKETQKDDILDELHKSEKLISEQTKKLQDLEKEGAELKNKLEALKLEEHEQKTALNNRKAELSLQISTQYKSQVSPWATLLSGHDAQKISREMGYLTYVSRAKIRIISAITQDLARISQTLVQINQTQKQLATVQANEKKVKADLIKEQEQYKKSLKNVEKTLAKRRKEAQSLKNDDLRLSQIIEGIETKIQSEREELRKAELAHQQEVLKQALRAEELRKKAQIEAQKAKDIASKAQSTADEAAVQANQATKKLEEARKRISEESAKNIEESHINTEFFNASPEERKRILSEQLREIEIAEAAARQLKDNAEIEEAKAKLARNKAIKAETLLKKAKEDEKRINSKRNATLGSGLQKNSPWPIRGELMANYGQNRVDTGDVWRGILIKASAGAPVKAIASGQVVFSNWVRGFGNLIIIDHGNHYLSVYAYNQSLLSAVGQTVNVGDVIAKVGATGGQVEPALYFEIRSGTQPVDPLIWLAQ